MGTLAQSEVKGSHIQGKENSPLMGGWGPMQGQLLLYHSLEVRETPMTQVFLAVDLELTVVQTEMRNP